MSECLTARVDDEIAHTASKGWMIAGLVGGAILGAAAVVVTGGTALVAVSAVAAGACAAGGLGELLGSMSWAPRHTTGTLKEGSPNVFINSRKAIRAHLSAGECDEHSGSLQRVAEGSIKVYINNFPASRIGDKLTCSAEISQGSRNVIIGGSKVQTDEISPEIPEWVNWTMLAVGAGAMAVLTSPAIALLSTLGAMGGGTVGSYAGGMLFGEGSDGQKWGMLIGSVIGGGAGIKGGARFDAWRAGKIPAVRPVEASPLGATALNKPKMSLSEAVGKDLANTWVTKGRQLAEQGDKRLSSLLTDDEVGALYGYTTNEGYPMVNNALRGQTELTPEIQAFADHATSALDKLPSYEGLTYRGATLPENVLMENQVGSIVSDPAFMSTDQKVPFSGDTTITINGKTGKPIDFLSEYKGTETEVLFKPGTKFEVVERVDAGGKTALTYKEL